MDYLTHVGYWCTPAYKLAHDVLQSKARYFPDLDVYDVEQLGVKDFDVVVFSGVYYHLKHPLLALTRLRRVMKNGGLIIVEGPVLPNDEDCYSTFHYRDVLLNDKSNWCVPTRRCLREWIECSFFDVEQVFEEAGGANGILSSFKARARALVSTPQALTIRTVMLARAVTRHDEFYSAPDPELTEYIE